ncbi:hypothetical protein STPH2_7526 [Streptomyces sp. KO7888]|nr:hypothetical protein [Streptomyces sp. KO7888]
MLAYLGTVVLNRAAGPLVGVELRNRHLHLPGDEGHHLIRDLRPTPGKAPVLRVVLQQQRETQSRGAALPRDKLQLVIEHRSVLDQLVHPHWLPAHGRTSCRRTPDQNGRSIKDPHPLGLMTRSLMAPGLRGGPGHCCPPWSSRCRPSPPPANTSPS